MSPPPPALGDWEMATGRRRNRSHSKSQQRARDSSHSVRAGGPRKPEWGCPGCGRSNNWACRVKCVCGTKAPQQHIAKLDKAMAEANKGAKTQHLGQREAEIEKLKKQNQAQKETIQKLRAQGKTADADKPAPPTEEPADADDELDLDRFAKIVQEAEAMYGTDDSHAKDLRTRFNEAREKKRAAKPLSKQVRDLEVKLRKRQGQSKTAADAAAQAKEAYEKARLASEEADAEKTKRESEVESLEAELKELRKKQLEEPDGEPASSAAVAWHQLQDALGPNRLNPELAAVIAAAVAATDGRDEPAGATAAHEAPPAAPAAFAEEEADMDIDNFELTPEESVALDALVAGDGGGDGLEEELPEQKAQPPTCEREWATLFPRFSPNALSKSALLADPPAQQRWEEQLCKGNRGKVEGGAGPEKPRHTWKPGITSVNGSSWKTARQVLSRFNTELVAVQETRLRGDQRLRAKQWLAKRGWGSVWSEAWTTAKNRNAGGVAILYRSHMDAGFVWAGVPAEVVPGRVVATPVRGKKVGVYCIYSAYLRTAEGVSAANAEIVGKIFRHAARHGRPFFAVGDFNLSPDQMRTLIDGAPSRVWILYDPEEGTCAKGDGTFSTLDFSLADSRGRLLMRKVSARLDVKLSPHRPVEFEFEEDLNKEVQVEVKCRRLPVDRVVGPFPAPPEWDNQSFEEEAAELVREWREKPHRRKELRPMILDKLGANSEDWNRKAGQELAGTLGIEYADKIRERLGQQVQTKTMSIAKAFKQRSFDSTDGGARAASWVEIRTREVAKLCGLAVEGGFKKKGAKASKAIPPSERVARALKTAKKTKWLAGSKNSLVSALEADAKSFWTGVLAEAVAVVEEAAEKGSADDYKQAALDMEHLHGITDIIAKKLQKDEAEADKKAYDKWAEQVLSSGAGVAHKLCRAALEEEKVEQVFWEDANTTCPAARLEADRAKWKELWGAEEVAREDRLEAEQVGTKKAGENQANRRLRGKQPAKQPDKENLADAVPQPEAPPRRRVKFKKAPEAMMRQEAGENQGSHSKNEEEEELEQWLLYGDAPEDGPASAAAIRAASAAFKRHTCAVDGWHPQHYKHLSDQTLARLGLLFWLAECVGQFPRKTAM